MTASDNVVARFDQLLKHLQIDVIEASQSGALVRMPLTEHHLNGWGAAHGGVICSLADAAFGAAANSHRDTAVVTLSTTLNFLRPGLKGPLTAESQAVHIGKNVVNYNIRVLDADGELIANGMISGYVTPKPMPKL